VEANHKKILKAIVLELRHMLEGYYNGSGWHGGDLEQRLNALGVWRDRNPLPADELAGISAPDREARKVVDAYLKLRDESGVPGDEAVAEFVRETAYTWVNRLLALRCMESRDLIDEVILLKDVYGGRSLEHNRLAQRNPELCTGNDDGLFAVLDRAFEEQAAHLPLLFDPKAPGVALKPGVAALKRAIALLSGTESVRGQEQAVSDVFRAPDSFGWAYQYWNTEEKDRVFEKVRTQKAAKIEGPDIIPATQLYTEPYMVKFLVQNSLGATWAKMRPDTKLTTEWEYYVTVTDRTPVDPKPVADITFLDPACGSGHFLLEAFDLFYNMYEEEGEITDPELICRSILERNLYGIDIDERAVQISEAALWMKSAEKVLQTTGLPSFSAVPANLVATNLRFPHGFDHLKAFLDKHPEDKEISPALESIIKGLQHADELGSLLRIEELVEIKLKGLQQEQQRLKHKGGIQADLYRPTHIHGQLPQGTESYDEWKHQTLARLQRHFATAFEDADLTETFFGRFASQGLRIFELLSRRYDSVATNPPYLGTKKQGDVLKSYLDEHYDNARYDLYTAFIERCRTLLSDIGTAALVTRSTWLYQMWYSDLRHSTLEDNRLRIVAALGSGAFEDFGGDVVDVSMIALANTPQGEILGAQLQRVGQKGAQLASMCRESTFVKRPASMFDRMPGHVINFDITPKIVDLFSGCLPLARYASVTDSVVVVSRFLRFWWECDLAKPERWFQYSKGGAIEKWFGFELFSLDWECNGARLKNYVLSRYPASKFRLIVKQESTIGRSGLTWTTHASGFFAVRSIGEHYIVSSKGPGIFANEDLNRPLLALLNSSVASYLLRLVSPGQEFGYKYVALVPVPELDTETRTKLDVCAQEALRTKARIVNARIQEFSFNRRSIVEPLASLAKYAATQEIERLTNELHLLDAELEAEVTARQAYGLSPAEADLVQANCGVHPCELPYGDKSRDKAVIAAYSTQAELSVADEDNDAPVVEEEEAEQVGSLTRVSHDSTLGRVAYASGVHPKTCYEILSSALTAGNIIPPTRNKVIKDYLSELVLAVVGFRWPSESACAHAVPDPDCIVPLHESARAALIDLLSFA
jgi:SAM-dependent methyltransferase